MPVEFLYLQLDHPASEHIFGTLSCYTDSDVYTTYVYKLTGWEENWRIEVRSLTGQTTMVVKFTEVATAKVCVLAASAWL